MTNEVKAVPTPVANVVIQKPSTDATSPEFRWEMAPASDVWESVARKQTEAIIYGFTR